MAIKLISRNKGKKEVDLVQLYERFIESSCECFFMFDKNLFALSMNEEASKLNGLKNVKKTGADIKEVLPNMYNTNRFDQFRDVLRTDKPIRFRDYMHLDGEPPRMYEIAAFKVGSGLGVVAVDVTKRSTQTEALRSGDEFSNAIQSVIHNPFIILDMDYQVLRANRAFYDHFFLKPVDVVNQSIYSLNETQWNIKALHELLEYKISTNGSAKGYEIKSYFTGLGDRTLKLNAKLFDLEEEGRKIIMLAINDITEIAKQRDNLRKLNTLYLDGPDPVVITNERGDIIEMNQEAIKLYGWATTELIDKPFKTILPPEVRENYDTLLEGVLGGMPVKDVETTHWTKKGEIIPTLMGIQVYKDQHDEIKGTIAYMKPVPSLKRAEDALQNIQDVLLTSNDPVAIVDLDGKIIDFNPAAEHAYSRQKESTTGKDGSILVSPDDKGVYLEAFTSCLEGKEGKNIEIHCITRQEVERATHLSFNLLMDARNQPYAMSVIEKQKSAKAKAERAYAHLLEAFLEIPDPVIIENLAGEVVDMNRTAANFFGWKKSDLLGKLGKLLIPTDQQTRHLELVQLCKNGEFVRDEKSTRWSKAGSYFSVSLTMFLLLNTNEEPEFIVTIAKPLDGVGILPGRGLALNMDTLYQEAVDPTIIEDMAGNVISMNKAAEALLGWKTREIMGKPMRNIIPADKHKLHEKILLLIQNDVPIKRVESKLWSKRGDVFPVAVSLVLIRDENGEPTAIASIHQNLATLNKASSAPDSPA